VRGKKVKAEIVKHPPNPAPEEVMMRWAKEWVAIDTERFMPHKGPRPFLPKRWIVERMFSRGWDRTGG
jgi:hypothetical protein